MVNSAKAAGMPGPGCGSRREQWGARPLCGPGELEHHIQGEQLVTALLLQIINWAWAAPLEKWY